MTITLRLRCIIRGGCLTHFYRTGSESGCWECPLCGRWGVSVGRILPEGWGSTPVRMEWWK